MKIRSNCRLSTSLGLRALFLAGLIASTLASGCVVATDEGLCGRLEARGANVSGALADDGACDDEESAGEEPQPEDDVVSPSGPKAAPQALCSPICDPI